MQRKSLHLLPGLLAIMLAGAAGLAHAATVKLTGDQEVPPVTTSATGEANISVAADGSISGTVTTQGVDGTVAHIHLAAAGKNGPVIVPLTKTADGQWSVPAGAKLSPEQLQAYQAGELYVNVHSAANKPGEIRAQLKP
ncbi:MAG: CHRD domain-containing protein [Proteobacteria bacterium]|jgi:hypothetical protein|nr:CHRD domain-containing protein [Methylibium sp.]MBY0365312.1 CHRD domain-containing protein [Burkholderiaceae bacterium]MCH8855647.1 CHRD domain-containing protein [Pseudomonadota bacterium]